MSLKIFKKFKLNIAIRIEMENNPLSGLVSCQEWLPHSGHEYYFSTLNDEVDRMWYDARSLCMSQGGDLASIHDSEEKDFIFETVNCQFKLNVQKLRGTSIQ